MSAELGIYVASEVLMGRRLFDVLSDPYIDEHRDDQLDLLTDLARDPAVSGALALVAGAPAGA